MIILLFFALFVLINREVVFSNGTMLSVSGQSEPVNERTDIEQKNKIPYSRDSQEVPMN